MDNRPADAPPAPTTTAGTAGGMWRSLTSKTSTFIHNASTKTADTVKQGAQNPTLRNLGATASGTVSKLSQQAAQGGTYVWNTTRQTTEGIVSRFSPTGLVAICQAESKEAPCPRLMLVCCTAICAGALASESLFTHDAPTELVAHLHDELVHAHTATLLPTSATPQVISCVIKHWLRALSEPLLTFKLVPALTSPDTPEDVRALRTILAELPLVNANTLHLLLDTCHRVASNSAINDSDAATLAAGLAPCLLWKPAAMTPGGTPTATPSSPAPDYEADYPAGAAKPQSILLDGEENRVFVKLLTHLITNYRSFV